MKDSYKLSLINSIKNYDSKTYANSNKEAYHIFLNSIFSYAKDEIIKCSGTQFDPVIAKVFVDILTNNSDKISEIQSKYLKF